jgi:phosphate:Na+ symporter
VTDGAELHLFNLFMGLFGGLALFLYGLELLSDALKSVAGGRMKDILGRLTTNRFTAVLSGAFVTAVVQSSTVTTVLVVGFVTANLMTLTQSVGIIMGANVGTTVTAQIIAFNVSQYSLLLVTAGFGVFFFGKRERVRKQGLALLGAGLVFFGMGVMAEAMMPLRTYQPFLDAMTRMEAPGIGILTGAIFSALIHSSAATTGVIIVLSSEGLLALPAGIALVLGANIGTCITALLAALGKPREAVRAATVHILFNVLGVLIWLRFIGELADPPTFRAWPGSLPRLPGRSPTHTRSSTSSTPFSSSPSPGFWRRRRSSWFRTVLCPSRIRSNPDTWTPSSCGRRRWPWIGRAWRSFIWGSGSGP